MIHFFQDSLINRTFISSRNNITHFKSKLCDINNFTVTFDHFNASLLNKLIYCPFFFILPHLTPNFWITVYHCFLQKYKAAQRFSTLKIIRNVSWVLNQYIRLISEGSYGTEDWSNDAENSALHHGCKLHFKIYSNRWQYYCFYCIFKSNKCSLFEHKTQNIWDFFIKKYSRLLISSVLDFDDQVISNKIYIAYAECNIARLKFLTCSFQVCQASSSIWCFDQRSELGW